MHDALLALLGTRATNSEDLIPDTLVLERELAQFMAHHLGVTARPDTDMFAALFQILARFGLSVPPQVAAAFRALATLEGTLGALSADFNLLDEGRAIAGELVADQLRFRNHGDRPGRRGWAPSSPRWRAAPSRRCCPSCRCCAGCRGGPTGSAPRWRRAGSPCGSASSRTSASGGSSRGSSTR
ncbi:hypothetical protein ACFQ0M_12055 [Kitasatospora aburaviensis]